MKVLLRRVLVVAGVVASLFVGALSIEAAAVWTRAAAPPAAPAVTVASLQTQLDAERRRSASLGDQLRTMDAGSQELAAGLAAADARIAADLKAAQAMSADLAATKKQLTALKSQMAAAKAALARAASSAAAASAGAPASAATPASAGAPASAGTPASGSVGTPSSPPPGAGGDDGD
jgi:hypothetical protein